MSAPRPDQPAGRRAEGQRQDVVAFLDRDPLVGQGPVLRPPAH
ncbi:hypothetical protein [Streptomyces aureus]|nr:hypothetical protein [Streptomyces aureus]